METATRFIHAVARAAELSREISMAQTPEERERLYGAWQTAAAERWAAYQAARETTSKNQS